MPGYPPNKTAASLGDGPSSYPEDSPLVPGWEPWVDRDVARYIRPGEDTVLSGEYGRVYIVQGIRIDKLDLINS